MVKSLLMMIYDRLNILISIEALIIENQPEHECRYTLLPPESCRSEVLFEATLRVEGPDDKAVAFFSVNTLQTRGIPCILHIAPSWVAVYPQRPDNKKPIDIVSISFFIILKLVFVISIYRDVWEKETR